MAKYVKLIKIRPAELSGKIKVKINRLKLWNPTQIEDFSSKST